MYPRDDKARAARHPSRVIGCEGYRLVDVLHHLRRISSVHGAHTWLLMIHALSPPLLSLCTLQLCVLDGFEDTPRREQTFARLEPRVAPQFSTQHQISTVNRLQQRIRSQECKQQACPCPSLGITK